MRIFSLTVSTRFLPITTAPAVQKPLDSRCNLTTLACSELFTGAPGTWILKVRKPPYYAGLPYPRVRPRITPKTFVEAEGSWENRAYRAAFTFSPKCYQRLPGIEPRELWSGDYTRTQIVNCLCVKYLQSLIMHSFTLCCSLVSQTDYIVN